MKYIVYKLRNPCNNKHWYDIIVVNELHQLIYRISLIKCQVVQGGEIWGPPTSNSFIERAYYTFTTFDNRQQLDEYICNNVFIELL